MDLIWKKGENDEDLFTFYQLTEEIHDAEDKKIAAAFGAWGKVKHYFLTMQDWYEDHELFHLIGYLITTGASVNNLLQLGQDRSKSQFKKELRSRALRPIGDVSQLDYSSGGQVKNALLLFNILSTIKAGAGSHRFPFHHYNTGGWDVEHIHSRTQKDIKGIQRHEWVSTMLWYFTGLHWEKGNESILLEKLPTIANNSVQAICSNLIGLAKDIKNDMLFNTCDAKIAIHLNLANDKDFSDSIGNLALLDSGTNRMYKNAFFPVKRKWIIEREKAGVFIPLCTKNIFLKAYSKSLDNLAAWTEEDAEDYMAEIIKTLVQ